MYVTVIYYYILICRFYCLYIYIYFVFYITLLGSVKHAAYMVASDIFVSEMNLVSIFMSFWF